MRRRRHHVAVLEWGGGLGGYDQSGDVCHVHEEEGAVVVGDFAEFGIVPLAGVGRSAHDDHGGFEKCGVALELGKVYESGLVVDAVGQTLKVDGGGGDGLARLLLLGVGVEAVCQVSAGGEVEAHDAVVWAEEGCVDCEVGWGARVGLDVDAPLVGGEAVGLDGALLAEDLDLVDYLVSSVVAGVWETLGVFVGEGGAEALHDGAGGEVLRGDEFEGFPLAVFLLFDEVVEFRVVFLEGDEASEFLWQMKMEIVN